MAQLIKRALALVFVQCCHVGSAGLHSEEADGRRVSEIWTLQISFHPSAVYSCEHSTGSLGNARLHLYQTLDWDLCLLAGESDTGESARPHLLLMCQLPIQTCPINCVYHANAKQSFSVFMQEYLFKIKDRTTACSHGRCQSSCQRPVLFRLWGGDVETARDVRLLWYDCPAGPSTPGGKWPTPRW